MLSGVVEPNLTLGHAKGPLRQFLKAKVTLPVPVGAFTSPVLVFAALPAYSRRLEPSDWIISRKSTVFRNDSVPNSPLI